MNDKASGFGGKVKAFVTGYWNALKEHVWLRWVSGIAIFVILGMIGSAGGQQDAKSTAKTPAQSTPAKSATQAQPASTASSSGSTSPAAAAKPAPTPKSLTPRQKVKPALAAIDWTVQDPKIKHVEFGGRDLTVTVATPEGGLQGPSTRDLNEQSAAIFQAIYGVAKYKKTGAVVVFKGGLVDSKTGKDLNNVNTGIYSISKRDARDINWSDNDAVRYTIDWSLYRDFVHPALKKDD